MNANAFTHVAFGAAHEIEPDHNEIKGCRVMCYELIVSIFIYKTIKNPKLHVIAII
jgi:hypothetical protein